METGSKQNPAFLTFSGAIISNKLIQLIIKTFICIAYLAKWPSTSPVHLVLLVLWQTTATTVPSEIAKKKEMDKK